MLPLRQGRRFAQLAIYGHCYKRQLVNSSESSLNQLTVDHRLDRLEVEAYPYIEEYRCS